MLKDKTGLILGVANKRSIAWHIAKAADREGARIALGYQGDRLLKSVGPLAESLQQTPLLVPCDVTDSGEMDELVPILQRELGHLDFLVHAVAFAKREELVGPFHDTSLDGWRTAMEISAFSLSALVHRLLPLMEGRQGSVLTLSYLGAERVIPHYNIMGVAKAALEASVRYLAADLGPQGHRVNAISAGPLKTLAASGVAGFSAMLDIVAERGPMKRNVTGEEVGDAALFFLSDLSRAVTAETLYVDCGYNAMGI